MALFEFLKKKNQAANQPLVSQQPEQPQQTFEKPADGNYISLVNDMLGPTPAEREAQERRLAENKAKMSGWLGLFQGLGALGDLYYAGKGVNPSQPNNQPQQLLNQHYAEEQQRLDNLYKNRQAYANMLYNIKRQAGEDARKDMLAKAQAKYYGGKEDAERRKMDIAEFNAKVNADYKQATLEQKNALNEVRIRLMEGQISKNEADRQYKLIMAGNAANGTETTTVDENGKKKVVVKRPAGRSSGSRSPRQNTQRPQKPQPTKGKISTGVKWKK